MSTDNVATELERTMFPLGRGAGHLKRVFHCTAQEWIEDVDAICAWISSHTSLEGRVNAIVAPGSMVMSGGERWYVKMIDVFFLYSQ